MANTLLTPSTIAMEALLLLENSMVASGLAYRDESSEFTAAKVGDAVTIKSPPTFTAQEYAGSISVQNITEGSTTLTLEKHFDVSVKVSAKEWTLELEQFSRQVIEPAVLAIAEGINGYMLGKYVQLTNLYFPDSAFPNAQGDLPGIARVLDVAKVPQSGRAALVSPTAKETLLGLDSFIRADARGDGGLALREASMGRVMGLDWYMDQQIKTHSAGTLAAGSPLVNGAVSAGATTMDIDGGAGTETIKKGDVFTVADAPGAYVFTADATASGGAITGASFSPAAPVGGFGNDKAITIQSSYKANMAMHPNAMALATVPLELPRGAADAAIISDRGLGIRVVSDYDMDAKSDTISFDVLCGAKFVQPELAMLLPE